MRARLHRHLVQVVGLGGAAGGLDVLGAEPLHHPDARHRLLDDRGELGRLLLDADHRRVQLRWRTAWRSTLTNGSDPEGQQRQQPGRCGSRMHGDRQHRDQVGDRERDQDDEVLDLLQVGVGPAHQLTGLLAVVEREVQALEVGEHPVAEDRLGPAGLAEREVAAEAGEGGGHERRPAAMSQAQRSDRACVRRPRCPCRWPAAPASARSPWPRSRPARPPRRRAGPTAAPAAGGR